MMLITFKLCISILFFTLSGMLFTLSGMLFNRKGRLCLTQLVADYQVIACSRGICGYFASASLRGPNDY